MRIISVQFITVTDTFGAAAIFVPLCPPLQPILAPISVSALFIYFFKFCQRAFSGHQTGSAILIQQVGGAEE